MRGIIKNKRGDIPTTILIIGVFAMCTYALISLAFYNVKVKRTVMETNVIENMNSKIEQYNLYKNMGTLSDAQINNFLGVQTEQIPIPNQPGEFIERKYISAEKTDKNKKIITIRYYIP